MSIFQRRTWSAFFDSRETKPTPKREEREAGLLQIEGTVIYCDMARRIFILQLESAMAGVGDDLLCCLDSDLAQTLPNLRSALVTGQCVRVGGTHVVPSVYKPFEFEVTTVFGAPSPGRSAW
jgi:hypothetical protein